MEDCYLATPEPSPGFQLPYSSSTRDVRVIDTYVIIHLEIRELTFYRNTLLYLKPEFFWQPKLSGFTGIHAPVYCFLISKGDHHVVFDLGVRHDWDNYAPKIVSLIKETTTVTMGQDVASVLNNDKSGLNIRSSDIRSVIWSHNHFDHIGDPTTFPSSTELVVGPGVRAASWPGWPSNPNAILLDSDIEGREVREVAFDTGLKIGRFDALDFFGDGSFYLLDAPGHAVGHLCALARTAVEPPTFVFMGADACHHPGILRPTRYMPLPRTIVPSTPSSAHASISACPGELLQELTIGRSPNAPFFTVAKGPVFLDHEVAMETVKKIQELDAAKNVFVVIAHDLSLRESIPLFPEHINGWMEENLKVKTRWLFCRDFESALRVG
jgi:glyoxylase-like metal-dependent hydrolase (beta-lactamase superfamily II)